MTEGKSGSKISEGQTNGRGGVDSGQNRLSVAKTYKIFIGGNFPRTESGRYLPLVLSDGTVVNICNSSRKDLRDAVVAARKAQDSWSSRSAYNRSQILYRIAELLEGRKSQFVEELVKLNVTASHAKKEVLKAIDTIVYYAGWCDKYIQVFSSVNPVSGSYFNFSIPEPTGIVGLLCDEDGGLVELVSDLLPIITGGNTAVVHVPIELATIAIDLAEVIQTSDVPGGVINMLPGVRAELLPHFGSHLDINSVIYAGRNAEEFLQLQSLGADHVLRIVDRRPAQRRELGPYQIMDTQEIKTTWHPVGK
ncbi:MAG: aldehyde dehydrogenase family protein [Saprospiraceae bacterium]|nr:aldehyde dehydrogenase family protein [Saprospiraceae bacterium]